MLRGLYNFKPLNDLTMEIHLDEKLIYLSTFHKDPSWIKVGKRNGNIGLVPANFIQIHNISISEIINFVNDAISTIDSETSPSEIQNRKSSNIQDFLNLKKRLQGERLNVIKEIKLIYYEIKIGRRCAFKASKNSSSGAYLPPNDDSDGEGDVDEILKLKEDLELNGIEQIDEEVSALSLDNDQSGGFDVLNSSSEVEIESDTHASNVSKQEKFSSNNNAEKNLDDKEIDLLLEEYDKNETATDNESLPDEYIQFIESGDAVLYGKLIADVRSAADVSHSKAEIAVATVLFGLNGKFPSESFHLFQYHCKYVKSSLVSKLPKLIKESPDAFKLESCFDTLKSWKNDEQERSWSLHEDERTVLDTLELLYSLLMNADESIFKYVMSISNYEDALNLILFYQMEIRSTVRSIIRKILLRICCIDKKAQSVFVSSILPMEFAREFGDCICSKDNDCILEVAKVLAQMMSNGESLPFNHYENFGPSFVLKVLETIENPLVAGDEELQIILTNFILGYNLQFSLPAINLTILGLSEMRAIPYLSQKLIHYYNQQIDPLEGNKANCNSVNKLLLDIFTSPVTQNLFYQNDVHVLLDILIRQLNSATGDSRKRIGPLKLLRALLRSHTFSEYKFRLDELAYSLDSILEGGEEQECLPTILLVKQLIKEFPHLFNKNN